MDTESSALHREHFHSVAKRERSGSYNPEVHEGTSPLLHSPLLRQTHTDRNACAGSSNDSPQVRTTETASTTPPLLFELAPLSHVTSSSRNVKAAQFGVEGLRIGRDPSCSDLVLHASAVSRLHCVLSVLGSEVFVHDNSFNGTFINGRRVGRGRCCVLHPHDTLSFMNPTLEAAGDFSFELAPLPGTDLLRASGFTVMEGMQRYELGPVIGQGSFASVRLAIDREANAPVAIKVMEQRRLSSEAAVASLHTEIEMMRGMDHPHVVKVLDAFEGHGCVALVMEYVRGGDLFDYVVGRGRHPFTEAEARHLFVQLLEALLYIHGRNIIHCDLKPENVLVDVAAGRPESQAAEADKGTADCHAVLLSALDSHQSEATSLSPWDVQLKLTDFGIAKYQGGAGADTVDEAAGPAGCGSPIYAAPELACFAFDPELAQSEAEKAEGQELQQSAPRKDSGNGDSLPASTTITAAVDVWSLGVLLYILCSGTVPKPPPAGTPVAMNRSMSELSAPCKDLITRMMVTDPAQRITLRGICHHAWLDGALTRDVARQDDMDNGDDDADEVLSVTINLSPRFHRFATMSEVTASRTGRLSEETAKAKVAREREKEYALMSPLV